MLSGEQVAQLDAQPTVSTGPKEGSDFFGQLRERVAPGRSKNITPAEKFDFVDRLFNVTEPSPVTKGVYAGVLADEYESFLEVYPKVEATIKQALTAQSMFPGNPDYAKKFMEVAATKGIDPWQLKLHQAMTHHVSGEANWSNLTSDQRHDAYHTVFGKLMSDSNPDTKKEWVMTGMLVTKRHIEAIQIATGAQYMTNEPHVINRRSRNQVTSPFGGGVVEQERLFDSRSRGKRLKDLLRADYDGYKREMAGSRDDGLRKERDYYKSANNNKLYSRHQIDYDQGLDFDPTRPIGRKQLDAVQQEYVERYRRYYKSTDRVVDRGSHIEDQLIRLAAAQEDTHWAYFKEDLNTGNTLNLIKRTNVKNGPSTFVFNEAKTLRIQSGMESVGEIPKGHDIELGKRLDEVMNRVLDSQKPEVEQRERTALKPKIDGQIKALGERISPTDLKEIARRAGLEASKKQQERVVRDMEEFVGINAKKLDIENKQNTEKASIADAIDTRDNKIETAKNELKIATNELTNAKTAVSDAEEARNELVKEKKETIPEILQFLGLRDLHVKSITDLTGEIAVITGSTDADNARRQALQKRLDATEAQQKSEEGSIARYARTISYRGLMPDTLSLIDHVDARKSAIDLLAATNNIQTATSNKEIKQTEYDKKKKVVDDFQAILDEPRNKEAFQAIKDAEEEIQRLTRLRTDRIAQYLITNINTPDSILSDARAKIIAIEKDSGVDFADSRQKEALETYIAEFLDSGKYDLIQNRSMNPNTLFRIDGIPTAAMEAVSYTSVLRPHVPPAYLEAMRVMVGDEVVETTPDGLALYDKFSKLITPNLFMKVYLSDSGRKSELEAVLGEPLQPEPTFFDSRFQRPDVRAIMMTSMGPDIANQILREMKAQAEAGILGKISPEASKRYQELSANRRTPDVIEVENSHTEANFESTVIGAKTKLVDKSKDQLAKVVPLEQFFTGKNLSPNQIKEIDIVVSTKRKALLNALSITTDGIVSISATDFNAQKASLLFLLRSVTNTTLSTTVLSDLDTYIVNETILNDLLNSSILFNHQRMSSEAKAVPKLTSEEVMKNRVERSQALIREFSILGKFDSTRESGHRVVDAKILQAIIFYNGGVGLDALEKAMVEMKLHNTSFSIAELLSSSSELYKLPFQPQEILDKILAKANAVRSVNSSLTVSSIYELNAGEVSKSIVLVAEDELGSVRGSQEIEALSFMMQSQEDYTRFARRDEVYDAQFWGVEGDDLTVALSTLPAIGTLSLAEELSAQIMARRKRKLTREN